MFIFLNSHVTRRLIFSNVSDSPTFFFLFKTRLRFIFAVKKIKWFYLRVGVRSFFLLCRVTYSVSNLKFCSLTDLVNRFEMQNISFLKFSGQRSLQRSVAEGGLKEISPSGSIFDNIPAYHRSLAPFLLTRTAYEIISFRNFHFHINSLSVTNNLSTCYISYSMAVGSNYLLTRRLMWQL